MSTPTLKDVAEFLRANLNTVRKDGEFSGIDFANENNMPPTTARDLLRKAEKNSLLTVRNLGHTTLYLISNEEEWHKWLEERNQSRAISTKKTD